MSLSFGHWEILFFLFIPATILAWIWLRDRFPSLGLGSEGRVALPLDHSIARGGGFSNFVIKCFQSASPLMLAAAVILAAGPRHLDVPKERRELTNIEFCLDLSGSMMARFGAGTRYDAAMDAMNGFVEKREGDAFGLTVFGDNAEHWIPLTTDASAFKCAKPFLNPFRLPPGYGGGTMIGLGLKKCHEVLVTREKGDKMIILISDGASFDLGGGEEETIGRMMRDDNIRVYAIHIGGGRTPPEVSTITNISMGQDFSPGDTHALQSVFREIDKMEVADLERTYAEVVDWFSPFSIAGLSFVGLSLLSLLGLRYTPW